MRAAGPAPDYRREGPGQSVGLSTISAFYPALQSPVSTGKKILEISSDSHRLHSMLFRDKKKLPFSPVFP
jgi:hypothetical protein